MKVLVTYGSKYGSTAEIAHIIAKELRGYGLKVELSEARDVLDINGYDAAVIGSAVYGGYWRRDASNFVRENAEQLKQIPVWTFSSGPVGLPPHRQEDAGEGEEISQLINSRGHELFAGKLDPDKLNFGERAIIRGLNAPTGDYREMDLVMLWARKVGQDFLAYAAERS